jgi:hypothetical protein
MNKFKNPVFIVGMPRSGTTLLQGILCNTHHYFPIPETHFFSIVTFGLKKSTLSYKSRRRIQHKLLKKSRIRLDLESFANKFTEIQFFEHVINQYNIDGIDTFLEKTPRHIFFYSKILKYYPDAKFICLIREPKNVISSQLSNSPKKNKSIIRLSLLYNKIASEISKAHQNSNVFLVRYEDLTIDPEKVLRQLFSFLEIKFHPNIVRNVKAPNGIVSRHEFWKLKNIEMDTIKANDPVKWKGVINRNQANLINFITKYHAANFNYKLYYKRLPLIPAFLQDTIYLFNASELKKVFSAYHG